MNTFLNWFGRNRKTIGYTVAAVNILGGLNALYVGNLSGGIVGLLLGVVILVDTKEFK